MTERLVLGSGSALPSIVADLEGDVLIGVPDDKQAQTLRETGLAVESFDPTDQQVLANIDADVVFVIEDTWIGAIAIAKAVRAALPHAYLLAYVGSEGGRPPGLTLSSDRDVDRGIADSESIVDADGRSDTFEDPAADTPTKAEPEDTTLSDRARLESLVDILIDRGQLIADRILETVDDPRGQSLWRVLRDIDTLAVVTHDNPDPDAIASGIALAELARGAGAEAEVCYYGEITHQENRAFVNVLDLELRQLDAGADLSGFDGFALVDHARPGVNNGLAPSTPIDIVIDHHPPRGPIDGRFVDLRADIGATSTLLVDYFRGFDRPISPTIGTALLFGIHVDTHAFTRGVSQHDFAAAASLVRAADLDSLAKIEAPSMDHRTLDGIARAIDNRRIEDELLFSCLGEIAGRDVLSQAADKLLRLEGISTVVVSGLYDGQVHVSARSRDSEIDIGETLRDAFDQIGSAGGHADMAGAQLDLGVLEAVEENESLPDIIGLMIADRVLETLDMGGRQTSVMGFTPDQLLDRYSVEQPDDDQPTVEE